MPKTFDGEKTKLEPKAQEVILDGEVSRPASLKEAPKPVSDGDAIIGLDCTMKGLILGPEESKANTPRPNHGEEKPELSKDIELDEKVEPAFGHPELNIDEDVFGDKSGIITKGRTTKDIMSFSNLRYKEEDVDCALVAYDKDGKGFRFKAHKEILAQFRFFKACFDKDWLFKESLTGQVELGVGGPDDIVRLLKLIYEGSYVCTSYFDMDESEVVYSADWKSLNIHLRMYVLGFYYTIPYLKTQAIAYAEGLRSRAATNLFILQECWVDWFKWIYSQTPSNDLFRQTLIRWIWEDRIYGRLTWEEQTIFYKEFCTLKEQVEDSGPDWEKQLAIIELEALRIKEGDATRFTMALDNLQ